MDAVDNVVRFQPPVHLQRYLFAVELLTDDKWSKQVHKIIDFGCGEMNLFRYLRNAVNINDVVLVDIDKPILVEKQRRVQPLMCDYLKKRPLGLRVQIIHADIRDYHCQFDNTDAVVMLEM